MVINIRIINDHFFSGLALSRRPASRSTSGALLNYRFGN